MLEQIKAIEAALAPLGYPTHRGYAAKVTPQYLVLSAPGVGSEDEAQLAGPVLSVAADFRVTAVGGTWEGVAIMLNRVRGILSPGSLPKRVPLPSWSLHTQFVRSELIDVDPSTTTTATGLHPFYGVDTYHLAADPIA
jgi:hypothetical protein